MAKMYKILMRQILFDIGEFEAETEEEAMRMAEEELDPQEIEDNLYFVLKITHENGDVEVPPQKGIDEQLYGEDA